MSYRFISTKVHGVIDYIEGIALILAPWIFGFSEVGGAAVVVPMVLGVGLIIYSIFTKYEMGLVKVLSMPYHLIIDAVAALFLLFSPWIFGFYDPDMLNVWVPHVVVGVAVLLIVLFTETEPRSHAAIS